MKIGVSSYSFKQMMNKGETTQLGSVELAKKLGFQAMEFTDLTPHDGSSEEEYAKKICGVCRDSGIEMGGYTIGADLINGAGVAPDREIDRIKRKIDAAAVLGAKFMRHDATSGIKKGSGRFKSFDSLLAPLAEKCYEITQYAKSAGIKTSVENHGFFAQDSERVEKLINEVGDDNFGALIDMGNFLCADEDPRTAVGRLAPYAFHVHAKDFHIKSGSETHPGRGWFETRGGNYLRGSIIGHGNVPVAQCLRVLHKSGYDGIVSIEFEGMEHPLVGLEVGCENLMRMVSLLG